MRVMKSEGEIAAMKTAGVIAASAMIETMKLTTPQMNEHQLSAIMEFNIKLRGAQRYSYPPVVAGGVNANTLHYVSNDMILHDGDLVLMDAGCEWNGYASDITRVWPVNGKFTKAQLDIYNLVLRVNKLCIQKCRSGISIRELQHFAEEKLAEGLIELGIMKKHESVQRFYPHNIGHYLGMDVHDTPHVDNSYSLQPGVIITVEPGLYIPVAEDIPLK
jgi:Xaa-Pro aminopeptidase